MSAEPEEKPDDKSDDKELIKEAKERFKASADAWSDNRKAFEDDLSFYVGETQWDAETRKAREAESRPMLTVNRMPQFVRQVTNDQRQNRPSIKVRPVDSSADPDVADIFEGLIRHIESNSNADIAYDNAFFYAVAAGFGFYRVTTKYVANSFNQEIYIDPIANPLSVYPDANCASFDGSDWEYCFIVDDMPREAFEKQYGKDASPFDDGNTENYEWNSKDTVRIAEYFYVTKGTDKLCLLDSGEVVLKSTYEPAMGKIDQDREVETRKVNWCLIGGDSVLEKKEWAGQYIPVIPVFGDTVQLNGKRKLYSLIRFSKDAQRMLNYYRTTETELLALQPKAPFIMAEGQDEGFEEDWAVANRVAFSSLKYKPVYDQNGNMLPAPQRQAFASPPTGVLQGAANAERDIMSTTGIYESSLGQKSNESSGRAILARQKEGDTATFHFIDNMTRSIRYCGKILIDLIPKVYDTEREVRILGPDDSEQMKKINGPSHEEDEYGRAIVKTYDVTVGQYDVTVSAGPSYNTRRQEAQAAMSEILQGNPQLMGVAGDLFVKAMDWPGADELAERLAKTLPPNLQPESDDNEAPMPPEVKAHIDQMGQQLEQAAQFIQQLQGQLSQQQFEQQIQQQKLQIDQFNAETQRLKVELEARDKAAPTVQVSGEAPGVDEAEKIQFDAELKLRLKEMDIEHQQQMRLLEHRLSNMQASGMSCGMDEHGNEMPSPLALAIAGMQETLAQQGQAISEMTSRLSAPKRVMRDEKGNIVGVETA